MPDRPQPVALVTGASSGLGVEIARQFASRGWAVAIAARRVDRMTEVARELRERWGGPVHVFAADLSDPHGARRLLEDVEHAGLATEVLVNNAGFGWRGRFTQSDVDRMLEMVQVNVSALTDLTRRALPGMIARAASGDGALSSSAHQARGVLNVASTAAFAPGPFMAVYYASKAYVESFSVAIREELRGTGVHCTCLCPGPVKTEFSSVAGSDNSKLFKRATKVDPPIVARAGVDGFERNRAVVIPGFGNRVVTMAARLLPRTRAAKVTRGLQDPGRVA
jgi:short-subunit dehydrogenase